jgi:hypothetical protein
MTQKHPVGFDTLRQASKPKPRSGTGRSHSKAVCKIGMVRAMAEAVARSAGVHLLSAADAMKPYPAGWLYLIKDACGVQVSSSCSWPEPRSFHLDPEAKLLRSDGCALQYGILHCINVRARLN